MEVNVIFFYARSAKWSHLDILFFLFFSRQLEVFELHIAESRIRRGWKLKKQADDQQNWKLNREMIQNVPFGAFVLKLVEEMAGSREKSWNYELIA